MGIINIIIEKIRKVSIEMKSNKNKIIIILIGKVIIIIIVVVSYAALYYYLDRPIYEGEIGTMKGILSDIKNDKYYTAELSNQHLDVIGKRIIEEAKIKYESMAVNPRHYYYGILTADEYRYFSELQKAILMENYRIKEFQVNLKELESHLDYCTTEKQKDLTKKYIAYFESGLKQFKGEQVVMKQTLVEMKVQNTLRVISYGCVILIAISWIWK